MSQGAFCSKDTHTVTEVRITDNKVLIHDIKQLREWHGGPVRCPLCGKGTIVLKTRANRYGWTCTYCYKCFAPRTCECGSLCQSVGVGYNDYRCITCDKKVTLSKSTADPNIDCVWCGSPYIRKLGFNVSGKQRYVCVSCNRKFCPCVEISHPWVSYTPPAYVKCPKCGSHNVLQSNPDHDRFGLWTFRCNNGCTKLGRDDKYKFRVALAQADWPTQDELILPDKWLNHPKYKKGK